MIAVDQALCFGFALMNMFKRLAVPLVDVF